MTNKERVMLQFEHKEADRIPIDLGAGKACIFMRSFYMKLLDYLGFKEEIPVTTDMVAASDQVLEALGCDVRAVIGKSLDPPDPRAKLWQEPDGTWYRINAWGVTSKMPPHSHYFDTWDNPMKNAETIEEDRAYQLPKVPKYDPNGIKKALAYRDAGYPVFATESFGNGMLQMGNFVYGFENWLSMLVVEPERCEVFQERLYQAKAEFWDNMFEAYGDTLDIIGEGDDLGVQNGTFISPAMTRELVIPYHKRLIDYVKGKHPHVKFVLHSCGSVREFIPDLIDAGYDALNPVQISAKGMEPEGLKRDFGKDIVFWGGGIDTQRVLPTGTIQEVKDMTKRNCEIFGKDGGFVFGTVHNVQPDVPIENFMAMWEVAKDFRF